MWWLSFHNFVSTIPDGYLWNCCVQVWKGRTCPSNFLCLCESVLFVGLSTILPGCVMSLLALTVEMGPHRSNAFSSGINTGCLSSLAFSHSLLQSPQCSLPLGGCGSSQWHWQEPLIVQGHTTSLGNLPTLISLYCTQHKGDTEQYPFLTACCIYLWSSFAEMNAVAFSS